MKILIALSALVFVVAAANPSEVASVIATEGFFIEEGADATSAEVGAAVFDARSAGGLFHAVVLVDEPPAGATTFADAVLDDLSRQEGTVLVVGPQTVGWASNNDVWTSVDLDRALDASLDASTSGGVVTAFVAELVEPSSSGGGGGGGGGWLLVIGVVLVGGIGFVIWRGSRSRRVGEAERLAELKAKAQGQIDAIANDILDDADEVSEADNADATGHFEAATAVYGEAAGRLEASTTARQVLDISAELDLAIWHLDAAEAILDGKPVPPKPEPPVIPDPVMPPPPPRSPASAPGSPSPLPTYQRRSQRRSGFGADDMLKAVLAMQAMRSVGRSWGGSSSRGRTSSPPRSSGRSRGGGRRR